MIPSFLLEVSEKIFFFKLFHLLSLKEEIKKFIEASLTMNIWSLVIHLLVACIIIICISSFVWKPTKKFIDKNKQKLDQEHQDLILYNRETKYYLKLLKDEQKKLSDIRRNEMNEVNKKVEKILFDSKKEAQEKALAIQADAKARVHALEEKAKEEIKNSVVRLSLELTEKLVGSNINKENSKRIIDSYIDELEKKDIASHKLN